MPRIAISKRKDALQADLVADQNALSDAVALLWRSSNLPQLPPASLEGLLNTRRVSRLLAGSGSLDPVRREHLPPRFRAQSLQSPPLSWVVKTKCPEPSTPSPSPTAPS